MTEIEREIDAIWENMSRIEQASFSVCVQVAIGEFDGEPVMPFHRVLDMLRTMNAEQCNGWIECCAFLERHMPGPAATSWWQAALKVAKVRLKRLAN